LWEFDLQTWPIAITNSKGCNNCFNTIVVGGREKKDFFEKWPQAGSSSWCWVFVARVSCPWHLVFPGLLEYSSDSQQVLDAMLADVFSMCMMQPTSLSDQQVSDWLQSRTGTFEPYSFMEKAKNSPRWLKICVQLSRTMAREICHLVQY